MYYVEYEEGAHKVLQGIRHCNTSGQKIHRGDAKILQNSLPINLMLRFRSAMCHNYMNAEYATTNHGVFVSIIGFGERGPRFPVIVCCRRQKSLILDR